MNFVKMQSCCSGQTKPERIREEYVTDKPWFAGFVAMQSGNVPRVKTALNGTDIFSAWKVRWSIGRMRYSVEPGLYCTGNPDKTAPVFVTANYKLSFDSLRKGLMGIDAWILVLDTKGINVWCAAGKGTFGTEELVRKIRSVGLMDIVSHRTLIVPQLGAVGVSAHDVAKATGFRVVYGPVLAKDIAKFLNNNMKTTKEMREVPFTFKDRVVLIPVELVSCMKYFALAAVFLVFFRLILRGTVDVRIFLDMVPLLGAVLVGCVGIPLLLPFIPGRAFALKGVVLGCMWAAGISFAYSRSWVPIVANVLLLTPISAFIALNFTGATTFTSHTEKKKEIRMSLPFLIGSAIFGLALHVLLISGAVKTA